MACEGYGVRLVIGLKANWKPKVEDITRGQVTREFFPGTDLDVLLDDGIQILDSQAIAADVHVGGDKRPLHLDLSASRRPWGRFLPDESSATDWLTAGR